jgi:5-amino-6-(5-phosphoribosylamino)uracil reductase
VRFNRLLPEPGTIGLEELRKELRFQGKDDRPYTLVNFVASVDGRATIEGRSAKLGDDGDRAMFHALRERVDAILAGTGTLATERYGRLIRAEEARARRVQAGLTAEPLACVVTRSGHVPTEIPLFKEPNARIVVFTGTPVQITAAAEVQVIELDPGELTLLTVMRRLRHEMGINTLMCEGGPTLFGALLREQLVDELFLTVAPKLVGGGQGQTIATGPELAEPVAAMPIWVLERHGSLFVRRRVSPDAG